MQQAFPNGIFNKNGVVSTIPNAKYVLNNTVVAADVGFNNNGIFEPSSNNIQEKSQRVEENIKELYDDNREMDKLLQDSKYCNEKKYMC